MSQLMLDRESLYEILAFLNSIEGAGYGCTAAFEIARDHVQRAVKDAQALEDFLVDIDFHLSQSTDRHLEQFAKTARDFLLTVQ